MRIKEERTDHESPIVAETIYTVQEVADYLKCSTRVILKDLRTGVLVGFKRGGHGHWRIHAEALRAYVQTHPQAITQASVDASVT